MNLIVTILGVLVVLLGLVGLIVPARFRAIFDHMSSRSRFIAAVVLRLAVGALLWFAADALRYPHVMRIIAAVAIAAAVGVLIMGQDRLDRLVTWWLTLPDGLLRLSAVFAAAFGAFLVYVAV